MNMNTRMTLNDPLSRGAPTLGAQPAALVDKLLQARDLQVQARFSSCVNRTQVNKQGMSAKPEHGVGALVGSHVLEKSITYLTNRKCGGGSSQYTRCFTIFTPHATADFMMSQV